VKFNPRNAFPPVCRTAAARPPHRPGRARGTAPARAPGRLAPAVLALALLAGCGDGGVPRGPAGEPAGTEALRGGTAVIAGYVELRGMNPLVTLTDLNRALERHALYMPLVMLDSALAPRPWLAESWDTVAVATDSVLLTFRLRRDVSWHDGTPTTAHDVATTFRYAADPETAWPGAAALALFHREIGTPDEHTVQFRFRRHPDFLEPFFLLPPLPAHLIQGTPAGEMARHPLGQAPVGNGPFRFLRRTAGEWVFQANPAFPAALGGPPALDRLVYRTVPEQTSLIAEILTGRVDLAVSIRPPQLAALQGRESVRVVTFPVANWVFLALNTRDPLFRQQEVRQAIALAVDRQALVDGIMGGMNVTGRGTVTPVHWAFDPERRPRHDPEAARALLEQAGWTDRNRDGVREDPQGRPLRFRLKVWGGAGSYRDLAEAVQAQLGRVGIGVQPEVVEFNTFVAQVQDRAFQAAIGNWTDNLLRKDDSLLFHSRNRRGPRQWTGFNSPRLDLLLDSLAVTMDRAAAAPLWGEYQQLIMDQAPLVVLFYAQGINAVHQRLEGVPDGDPRGPLATVARWHMAAGPR
jgi:peptide/nickel transport system substrate-binding protein